MKSMSLEVFRPISQAETNGIQFSEDAYISDRRMPAHEHPESHIVLCLGGAIEHHSSAGSYVATEKTVAYVPAFEAHSNAFRGTVRTFQLTLNEASFGLGSDETNGRSLNQHHNCALLMQSIYREFRSPDKYSNLMLHALTTELLVSIHRDQETHSGSKCQIPWLMQVRDLLHEELSESLQLDYLAAKVGVHPGHLTRAFRKHFGKSIGEYVRELRISRARHLLETSDQSIGSIALTTGFTDQSHFTRTFKAQTGRTPLSYRSQQ